MPFSTGSNLQSSVAFLPPICRMNRVKNAKHGPCPFCNLSESDVVWQSDLVVAIRDRYPVTEGHTLVIPRRHMATYFDAKTYEKDELWRAVDAIKLALDEEFAPDGYNVGFNAAPAAGQTVMHLHIHVIPRRNGDVRDPRGGIRGVIPSQQNYLVDHTDGSAKPYATQAASVVTVRESAAGYGLSTHATGTGVSSSDGEPGSMQRLVRVDRDPLLPHLLRHMDTASEVAIAVGFVLRSGVDCLHEHLWDLLKRGGSARLLTGDYLGISDPNALLRLLDLKSDPELSGDLQLRVFETSDRSFHPKAYLFFDRGDDGIAYVGSSNLSRMALDRGFEWNYRVVSSLDARGFQEIRRGFEQLFRDPATRPITDTWIEDYRRRRKPPAAQPVELLPEPDQAPPTPHGIQQQALQALEATRRAGNSAGLVVLATGLGKTWLSAFDSVTHSRVLFVAHRDEILSQAMKTYRRIRPQARLGKYTGTSKTPEADVVFASVQTLSRKPHLQRFDRRAFDYIVIDEFHHAAARSYRGLITYFEPQFLLGLTATPERTDGGDLLGLCQENLVFRCDLAEGIERELLCPFRYFGVPDDVDYQNIPWRSSRFDEHALTAAVATKSRANNALDQHRKRGGDRTMAFCCSQRHAEFMADHFNAAGVPSVAVHSGQASAPRATSLERLAAGELKVVFSVDMFNEGLDLPKIDTVMMLRPTESRILWLQQFGRGLRKVGDKILTVIDYIGNHRIFLTKTQALFSLGVGDAQLAYIFKQLREGSAELPAGCEVTYDLKAIQILESLLRKSRTDDALRLYYIDFRERHGQRPTASEAFRDGYNPRSARSTYGSWFGFVEQMGDLPSEQQQLVAGTRSFFKALEKTPMSKSFKMLTLLAMLNEDRFPGTIPIAELAQAFRRVASRTATLREELGESLNDDQKLRRLLEQNPIAAWCGGQGTGNVPYFGYQDGVFHTAQQLQPDDTDTLQELVRELAEWRLADYLQRKGVDGTRNDIRCKVFQTDGRPILKLPDRKHHPGIPSDWQPVTCNGRPYQANFVKIEINVMQPAGSEENVLPELMRDWFGPDAGQPGTNHHVMFRPLTDGWEMLPVGQRRGLNPWRRVMREQIPEMFGLSFSTGSWNQGYLMKDNHAFLLVNMDKQGMQEAHQYEDRFLTPTLFEWQSQNRMSRAQSNSQKLRDHNAHGTKVHLFVRAQRKIGSKAAPFLYCGDVAFVSWANDNPITIQWRLSEPVPETLREELRVP